MNPRPPTDEIPLGDALDAVGQAVIITGVDGVIRYWNRAAERMYGWRAEEALGRPILEVTPSSQSAAEAEAVLDRVRSGHSWSGDAVLRRRDGSTFLAAVSDTPVLDASGRLIGIIGVSEDVTEERRAVDAVRRGEQRLRLALEAGRLGVWEYDGVTDDLVWDRTLEQIFGLEPGGAPSTFEGYAALLHPEDRAEVLAQISQARVTGSRYVVEHRVIRPDGVVRWVHGDGRPLLDGEHVTGMIGVSADVTEWHEAEAERARLLAEEAEARREVEAARTRLEFLADATAAMSEPLELQERLQRLARLGVPRFADASAVFLLDETGEPAPIALHHRDARQEALVRELLERYPARLDSPVGVGLAIRKGRTAWMAAINDETLEQVARSEQHLADVRSLRVTAGVVVPLVGPQGPFGAVGFLTVDGRRMTRDDVALAEELCARIAVSVYNGQLLEAREADRAAHRQQAALLQSVLEASVDGMVAVDREGRVLARNQRFLQLCGLDDSDLAEGGSALLEAMAMKVADAAAFRASATEAYESGVAEVHDEVAMADGRVLDRHGRRIVDDEGRDLGFTWSVRDVTNERRQQAEVAAVGERFATLARTLQQSLLPPSLPTPGGIELAARYHPAYEGVDVGGDFYDVFAVGDDWVLVIGDVCGKGAEAASLTALVRYTIRAAAIHDPDAAATLVELNTAMVAQAATSANRPRFATVCCMRLRTSTEGVWVDVACGGHPLPVIVRADGTTVPGGRPGTLLGVFDTVDITTRSTLLHPGDTLIAVTDGVLEARDASGRLFDTDGLDALVGPLAGRTAAEIGAAIEDRALEVQDGTARDDIAVLVARIR